MQKLIESIDEHNFHSNWELRVSFGFNFTDKVFLKGVDFDKFNDFNDFLGNLNSFVIGFGEPLWNIDENVEE